MKLKSEPFFSIIIPCLNEEHFVPFLLEDLQKQSYQDFEVIVVDGNSDDQTQQKVKEFPFTKLLVSQKQNVSYQRNLGATEAQGEYLVFLDADVRILEDFMQNVYRYIGHNSLTVGGTISKPLPISHTTKLLFLDKFLFSFWNLWITVMQYISPQASGNCIFCQKNIHIKIKGFNEEIRLGEDIEYVQRAAKYGKFRILPPSVYISTSIRRYHTQG